MKRRHQFQTERILRVSRVVSDLDRTETFYRGVSCAGTIRLPDLIPCQSLSGTQRNSVGAGKFFMHGLIDGSSE